MESLNTSSMLGFSEMAGCRPIDGPACVELVGWTVVQSCELGAKLIFQILIG